MMDPSWQLYLPILIGPFVQEDAAVIAAAALCAADPQHFPNVFIIILIGLIASDAWKYWIGYAAHTHPKMRAMAEKERVVSMGEKVKTNTVVTLFAARFIPFARVPSYIACGYFKIPYWKFFLTISVTALLYVMIVFAIAHYLGELFGDKIEIILPIFGAIMLSFLLSLWGFKRFKAKSAG